MDTSEFKVKGMDISELKVEAPYDTLFLINQPLLDLMKKNMEKNNYDESKPITIWKGRNVVIDGHIRLQAAKSIGLTRIPVVEIDFKDEDDALGYAIRNQLNFRRSE